MCRHFQPEADGAVDMPNGMRGAGSSSPSDAALSKDASTLPNPADAGGAGDASSDDDALLDTLPGGPPSFQFRADTVTMNGAGIATIPNRRGIDALVAKAGELSAPAADSLLGGAPALVFNGTQWLDSNLPPTAWRFLHDGTGSEVFLISVATSAATQCLWSTHQDTLGASSSGARITRNATTTLGSRISNGTTLVSNQLFGAAPTGAAYYVDTAYGSAEPVDVLGFLNAALGASGTQSASPSSGNPEATLRLGACAVDDSLPAQMKFAELLIFPRVLHEYERQLVREYIQARYGITAPSLVGADRELMSLLPFSWLDAAAYDMADGKVTSFRDRARPGHAYAQSGPGYRVSVPTADSTLNGQLSATFTGGQRYSSTLEASEWKFLTSDSGSEVQLVFVPTNFAAAYTFLSTYSTAGSNALQLYANATPAATLYIQNESNQDIAGLSRPLTAGAAQCLSFRHFKGQSPNLTFRANGAEVTGNYLKTPGTGGPSNPLCVGANPGGTAQFSYARIASVIAFNRELSAVERTRLQAATQAKWGIAP
ncbi:MAG TPA: hypothetical protein VI299_26525 [Polyangiales bacterium]